MTDTNDFDNWFEGLDNKSIEIINPQSIVEDKVVELTNVIETDNSESTDENKNICIDDILKKNPDKLNAVEIMQYECSIAYFIQVLIESSIISPEEDQENIKTKLERKFHPELARLSATNLNKEKIDTIIEYLQWISIASDNLAKRINQPILFRKPQDRPSIVRSSYNFCMKYTQCKNFYSKNELPTCKEHHYVHSQLRYDVESIIYFLRYVDDTGIKMTKEDLNNLYLSIKTICFVTRHMAKEISYIDYITKSNSETYHRNNPVEFDNKIYKQNDEPKKYYRPENKRSFKVYNKQLSKKPMQKTVNGSFKSKTGNIFSTLAKF